VTLSRSESANTSRRRATAGRFRPVSTVPPVRAAHGPPFRGGAEPPTWRGIIYAVRTVVRAKTTVALIADAEVSDKLLED